ncbi:MAG: hypothetical protein RLZZ422_623 [Pseudomonadota bacterium]|jgi:hypothetical protein
MIQRIFIDANIINDIYDASRVDHLSSYQCLEYCLNNNISLITSCDLVTTIYYINSKKQGRLPALQALEQIQTMFDIAPFGNYELELAIKLMRQDQDYKDLEDTIQYILAQQTKCDLILTNDTKFIAKNIGLVTSKSFLKTYK